MNPFLMLAVVTASAVWHPPANLREQIISSCGGAGSSFQSCFLARMHDGGATPEAVAFATAIRSSGYMAAWKQVGNLGLALISYPFRANQNSGLVIANSEPSLIDIDRLDQLPVSDWQNLRDKYPKANLWPGDRSRLDAVVVEPDPDGSHRFVVEYRIQDGCHACALLAHAFYAFRFDSADQFAGVSFVRLVPVKSK